jgi:RNA polymerase sigma-70 factor (ECF subfamily)
MRYSALMEWDNRVSASKPGDLLRGERGGLSDEALLRLCAEKDSASLEELARRYQAPLYRFLLRMMGSPEDAEEAVLEVFVKAWQNAHRFQYRARVGTWLYRIATNLARDKHLWRISRPREVGLEIADVAHMLGGSAEEDALHRLELGERVQALQRALAQLNPFDRMLLVLYYLEEWDYSQIQALTELSYPVLKTRLSRARRRLRKALQAEENKSKR